MSEKHNPTPWYFAWVALVGMLLFTSAQGQNQENSGDGLEQLEPFVLTEVESVGYSTSSTSAGSRFIVPITELPQSVIAINREIMDDVAAKTTEEALQFVSGVNPIATGSIGSVAIRGLEVRSGSSQLIDGLPGGSSVLFGAGSEHETEFLERYEVVKGAAGTLYGTHSLGGLINRIYKDPTEDFAASLNFTYSDIGDTYQTSADVSGPIDKNGELKYRFVGVFRDGETMNGGEDSKEGFYSTFSYKPKKSNARVWVRAEYRDVETGHETPSVFYDNVGEPLFNILPVDVRTVPVPNNEVRNFQYGELGISNSLGEGLFGNWDMRLVTRWFQRKNNDPIPDIIPIGFAFIDANNNIVGTTGTSVPEGGGQAFADTNYTDIIMSNAVTRVNGPDQTKQWGTYLDMTGEFKTGPISHRMLIYSQYTNQRGRTQFTNYTIKEEFGGSQFTNNLVIENAFSILRQNTLPESMQYFENPVQSQDNRVGGETFGAGIQNNMSILDNRINVVAGVRYDHVVNNGVDNLLTGESTASLTQNEWTWKFGAVVKPLPDNQNVSIFYNFSQTFDPIFEERVPGSGDLLDNLQGEANEIGVKLELFNSALVFTGSYFDNELEAQPLRLFNPDTGLDEFEQGGISTIDGIEFDLAWQVNENIAFVLAASDVDSRDPNGGRVRAIQNEFNYSFLGRYQFLDGPLAGLRVGVTVKDTGDRIGSNRQDFTIKGYTKLGAFARYSWGNFDLQFNAYNLTDEEAALTSIFSALVIADQPRNFKLSGTFRF